MDAGLASLLLQSGALGRRCVETRQAHDKSKPGRANATEIDLSPLEEAIRAACKKYREPSWNILYAADATSANPFELRSSASPAKLPRIYMERANAAAQKEAVERGAAEKAVAELLSAERSASAEAARVRMDLEAKRVGSERAAAQVMRAAEQGAAKVAAQRAAAAAASAEVERLVAVEKQQKAEEEAAAAYSPLDVSDELLGEGATAKVYRGYWGMERLPVAAKVASKDGLDADEIRWLKEEIAIQSSLAHRNVCSCFGSLESSSSITLVLQLCEGGCLIDTLMEAHEKGNKLKEPLCKDITRQMLGGLCYCESVGVHHRDVKLANLCWVDHMRTWLVLADFGYASRKDEHRTFAGSANFAAPEVHQTDEEIPEAERGPPYSTAKADAWSAGVVLFTLLAGALPFSGEEEEPEDRKALREKVCTSQFDVPLKDLKRSAPSKELVKRLLTVDAAKRISLKEASEHKWLKG